jgi:transcription elongation factor Elf1
MVVTIVSVGLVYMKKYKCPVCGEETISILKKQIFQSPFLSDAINATHYTARRMYIPCC